MLNQYEAARVKLDPLIYVCFDTLVPITEDRILATHENRIALISYDGIMICEYDFIEIPQFLNIADIDNFNPDGTYEDVDGYLIVEKNGLYGIIDYDGNIIVAIENSNIVFYDEHNFGVMP